MVHGLESGSFDGRDVLVDGCGDFGGGYWNWVAVELVGEEKRMKKYVRASVITSGTTEEFLNRLSEEVDGFQESGLQVEVQYHPTGRQVTALILGYEG